MSKTVIEFKNVHKYFGANKEHHVLNDINLSVKTGEVVVIIGPSGSGKSTLCRTINRLESIDSGTILIDGEPLPSGGKALAAVRSRVCMVFQSFNLFEHKKALDNVSLAPMHVLHKKKAQADALSLKLLERVGLSDHAHKMPSQLSGGQQQRVAIARALAMSPEAILFDEPTSALDPEMINEVLDVMTSLAAEGMTMVIVTHEMSFARKIANRIVFMADGQILEVSPPEEFFTSPKTERAKQFLSSLAKK